MQHENVGEQHHSTVSQSGINPILFFRLTLINNRWPEAVAFPTPTMQSQIHELAKTLPPPRKQNTACDACRLAIRDRPYIYKKNLILCLLVRARKVKCNRLPGQEKVYLSFFPFILFLLLNATYFSAKCALITLTRIAP